MPLLIGNIIQSPTLPTLTSMIFSRLLQQFRPQRVRRVQLSYGTEKPAGLPTVRFVSFSGDCVLIVSSGATNAGAAIAGTKNAFYFWKQGVCAALDWNINLFYFSAFDEPWKPDSKGDDGKMGNEKHWGAFTVDRQPKFDDYSCKYLVPDTTS